MLKILHSYYFRLLKYHNLICGHWTPVFHFVQLLAGADVNAKTKKNETALHLAAAKDQSVIASIVLENGIDYDIVDENLNNGKHDRLL